MQRNLIAYFKQSFVNQGARNKWHSTRLYIKQRK